MRLIASFAVVTAALTTAVACTAPITSKSADLGTFDVDGPVYIDVTMTAVPYGRTDCSDLEPSVTLWWTGPEAAVELDGTVHSRSWEEDAIASDSEVITVMSGQWSFTSDARCRFDASLTMTSDEPLTGTIHLSGSVGYAPRSSAERVDGTASVEHQE